MPRMDKLSNYRTTIAVREGTTIITYIATPIVAFDRDKIVLNTGGYKSVTTKRKMNQAAHQFNLPYGVYQKKGKWFVTTGGTEHKPIGPFVGDLFTIERRA